jgi:hypothetical protein
MKCSKCSSTLVSLYCREGAGGKSWVKVDGLYCKKCKKISSFKLGD